MIIVYFLGGAPAFLGAPGFLAPALGFLAPALGFLAPGFVAPLPLFALLTTVDPGGSIIVRVWLPVALIVKLKI
jgi:hypothetical protein